MRTFLFILFLSLIPAKDYALVGVRFIPSPGGPLPVPIVILVN